MNGAPTVVQAPPIASPRIGLIAAARVLDIAPPVDGSSDLASRWGSGFAYAPENCRGAGVFAPCSGSTKTVPDNLAQVIAEPYYVWAGDKCSSFGFEARDYAARAQRLLLASESKQIANELWTGELASAQSWTHNRFFAAASTPKTTSGATAEMKALACLEQALADCGTGAQGMIHCTRGTAIMWDAGGALRREAGYTLTINDTIIVADAGYDGSGPGNVPATSGHVWAYATSGIIEVRRSPIDLLPRDYAAALDRSNNTVTFRAERLAAATWDGCCVVAAEIDLPLCVAPGS